MNYRLLGLAMVALLGLTGCRAFYLLEQAAGQLRILAGREPIDEMLASEQLKEQQKRKLRLIVEAKRFAEEELGLDPSRNYETFYDTGGRAVGYSVSACPPDSLEPVTWWFPVVGSIPYLGYFREESARRQARALRRKGLDVSIGRISAYSTLGWFSDSVFSTFLQYGDEELVNVIIHELVHGTIYAPGHADFNEAAAVFLADRGTILMLQRRGEATQEAVRRACDSDHDEQLFSDFIARYERELRELYALPLSREGALRKRVAVYRRLRLDFARRLKPELRTDRLEAVADMQPNNARFLQVMLYHRDIEDFEKLCERLGGDLRRMVEVLREIAASDAPLAALREAARD